MVPSKTLKWLFLLSLICHFFTSVAVGDAVEQQNQAVAAPPGTASVADQPSTENSKQLAEQPNNQQNANENESATGGGGAGRALAAPLLRGPENAIELNGEQKPFFKIHYRDGVQKAIFDETPRRVPADFEDTNSVGGAAGELDTYDDVRLVEPQLEQPLFIPEIYRNDTREGITKAPKVAKGGAATNANRPLVSPEVQSRPPVTVRTTTPRPGAATVRPPHPFGRPPPPPVLPQQPRLPPQHPQPPRPFPPPNAPLPQPFRPNSQPPPLPHSPNTVPRPMPNQQQQRPLTPNIGVGQIRTGVCHQAIFYTPQSVSEADIRRIYTHFAVVVSVDQCARTCHEFNCDVAIMDPISRHCQFNPSTAFRVHPACPQWPNPLYRNNVKSGQGPVRIACVTCQQRRRVPKPGQNSPMPFNGQGKQQQQTISVTRPAAGAAPPPPPHVIRTTVRDRLNAGPFLQNGDNGPRIAHVANAAAVLKTTERGEESETGRDLSAEFHKLERLLKSAEDYLDETEPNEAKRTAKEEGRKGTAVGREVPSWTEGHPQGEGFSPLRINPLRRPFMEDPSRPHAIFYSTDKMPRPKSGDNERNGEEFYQRRIRRNESEERTGKKEKKMNK
ncbi:hypothetical protein niasHS_006798 [Heterodera schachtii]|uniref:Uncharacterized protein n=1 Tax=Heterodera schachtii TaxID=97005 RepID=A0ABD2JIA5_HETSC